jgi:hypothetical protein
MRINKALRFSVSAVMLAMIALTSVSCSGPESSQTFERILSVIPDTPDTREWVAINDYARMRQEFQIDAPSTNATVEEQKEYLFELLKWPNPTERLQVAASPGFVNDAKYLEYNLKAMHNLGLGFWSIDQDAEAGLPPAMLDILKGRFDLEKTRQALAVSAKDDPPSIETYGGNTIFSWGGDNEINLQKSLMPPVYDFIGRGGRFVVQRDYAFRTTETPGIKLLIDTQNGKHASLSDVSEFQLMAQELSSLGALSALLTNRTQSIDFARSILSASGQYKAQDVEKLLAQEPRLLRYQTIALGMAKDEKGPYALIILVHADDPAAAKNVTLLRQRIEKTSSLNGSPWTSIISSSSVTSHGRVLTAKLYGYIARNWLSWYYQVDPLVLHE